MTPCKHPKVSEMTEEHYEPLWGDTPAAVYACLLCEKCGAIMRAWAPVALSLFLLAGCHNTTAPRECIAVSQPNNPLYHADTVVITCKR